MTNPVLFRACWVGLALWLGALSGCSWTPSLSRDSFRPYVPDVVQGNFVSREQRQMLRPGMSRTQVRDVLGTPLITSLFHAERWDYVFTIRRQGVPAQQFRLTLTFRNELLSAIDGDELPSEAEFAQRLSGGSRSGPLPALEASEEQLRRFPPRATPAAATAPSTPLPASYPPLESAPR